MSNWQWGGRGRRSSAVLTVAFAFAVAGDATALVALNGAPVRVAHEIGRPQRWTDAVGADAAVGTLAAAALWLVAAWLAAGLLAVLAARLPGAAGALGTRIAVFALPTVVYRAAAGAAGLGVLLSPAVASAATGHGAALHPGGTATAAASVAVPSPLPATDVLPAPLLPAGHASTGHASTEPAPAEPRAVTVTVRPGDSLWRIAATQLGPAPTAARIAATWPRWFAANRAVIGADPDYLVPGEVLHDPYSSEDQR